MRAPPALGLLRGELWRLAGAVGLAFSTLLAGTALLGTSAWLIASAALHPSIAELQIAIVGVRAFGLGRGVLRYLERLTTHDVTLRILTRLRSAVFGALAFAREPAHLRLRSGEILARAVTDVAALEGVAVRLLVPTCAAGVALLATAGFLSSYERDVAMVASAGFLVVGVGLPAAVAWRAAAVGKRLAEATGRLSSVLVEIVQGVAELAMFGREESEVRRLHGLGEAHGADQLRLTRLSALGSAAGGAVADTTAALVLVVAALASRDAQLSGVSLVVVVLVTLALFEAATPLPAAFQSLGLVNESARRVLEILATPRETRRAPAPRGEESQTTVLDIRHLTFSFPDRPAPAVADVTLSMAEGERVALVGLSGSGKSTLGRIVAGLLPAPDGSVSLGGGDATHSPERAAFYSAQDARLFSGSVRENVLLAREDAPSDDVEGAVSCALLDATLASWPAGLETAVGEQGLRLSAGERQRVLLARALVTGARLLILDEPTAHLDAVAEQEVFARLLDSSAVRSLLLITHRVVALRRFDRIAVLDSGRVVESGSFEELAGSGGLFAQMLALQRSEAALDDARFVTG